MSDHLTGQPMEGHRPDGGKASISSSRTRPNVFTISPSADFLPCMIDALLEGRLIRDFALDDPSQLGRVLIYVPTRRVADGLKASFLAQMQRHGWPSAILPRIQIIGDAEDDLMPFKVAAGPQDGFWQLPQAMDGLQRRLTMTQLVHQWASAYARAVLNLKSDQPLHVSSTPTDAAYMAIDLLSLIDAVHRERSDWALLDQLVPDEFGGFWQMSLEFLKIATSFWPQHLIELDLVDPVQRRNAVLALEIEAINLHKGPIIAAGSTGSIPATADLLEAVARHLQGALILPGLDHHLDEPSWQGIGTLHPDIGGLDPVAGHPQFNLKQLLDQMSINRDEVEELAQLSAKQKLREKLTSEALRPAESTDKWEQIFRDFGEDDRALAFGGVAIAEAESEQEEARMAALALREVLADPDKRAALVTPDRALARRVMLELKRWGITVEDTAGMPLAETPPALLLRLMLECWVEQFDAVRLLALLKHPLASFGLDRSHVRQAARHLELNLLRGPKLGGGLAPLLSQFHRKHNEAIEKASTDKPVADIWEKSALLLTRLEQAFTPLCDALLEDENALSFEAWLERMVATLEQVAMGQDGAPDRLYDEEAGRNVRTFFDRAKASASDGLTLAPQDLAPFLVAMMSGETVHSHEKGTSRLQLLGTLEARLLDVDRVVIGGLNEGSWPADIKSDAWLSRPMRAGMRLEPPERRVGLAAHDFAQAMGRGDVVLLRPAKAGGEPTVASRWLQRLEAVAGDRQAKEMHQRGQRFVDWARQLDAPRRSLAIARPDPKPPLELRPRNLSVTEIETWVRDPYALYAKHVLGLRPLDDIASPPGGAEKGSIIHDCLSRFTESWQGPLDETALAHLMKLGEEAFEELVNFPDVLAFWWPRFERIARWFIFNWEAEREELVEHRHTEISGVIELDMTSGPFKLRGRADRLDVMKGDSLDVIDFKTGMPPSAKQVLPGFAPQLALEGYMAKLGGFKDIPKGIEISNMEWVRLSGGRIAGEVKTGIEKDYAAEDIVELIGKRLLALIVAYDDPAQGYRSRSRPMFERFESPFDHLARVKEWSVQSGEES